MRTFFKKICGVWFAVNVFGNCFSPALCLTLHKGGGKCWKPGCWSAKGILTLRFKGLETTIYWRGAHRFDWNSAHLARRFGVREDAPFGDVYRWRGHIDL